MKKIWRNSSKKYRRTSEKLFGKFCRSPSCILGDIAWGISGLTFKAIFVAFFCKKSWKKVRETIEQVAGEIPEIIVGGILKISWEITAENIDSTFQ